MPRTTSRRVWCSLLLFLGLVTASAGTAQETLDLGRAEQWTPGRPDRRDRGTQLMIIDILDIEVPGLQAVDAEPGDPPSIRSLWAALWTRGRESFARGFSARRRAPEVWLYPRRGGGQVTRATRVHAYLSSLGRSHGEAFEIQIINDGPEPIRIGGDGIVVQPVRQGPDKVLRAELQQIATRSAGAVKARANAYCLEFKVNPPEQGTLFEAADESAQKKYTAAREILRASRRLQQDGELEPDSDPAEYFHSIRQWAIWTHEQSFTLPKYTAALIDRTKKSAQALRVQFTREMENALKAAVPHRWSEIVKILRAAGQPVPGA